VSFSVELNPASLQKDVPPQDPVWKFGIAAASVCHCAVVGNLNPEGQGLFVPFTPCHKLLFCPVRQSQGVTLATVTKDEPGVSVFTGPDVTPLTAVPDVELVQFIFS
jgi:hypothetical protein